MAGRQATWACSGAYGALGTYVAEPLIGGSGPIRESYLDIAPDGTSGRTETAWPVLRMAG